MRDCNPGPANNLDLLMPYDTIATDMHDLKRIY